MLRFLFILGTRPEIVKLAPVIFACRNRSNIETTVIHTGQHKELADEMFAHFGIVPDIDLQVMEPNQSLSQLTEKIMHGLSGIVSKDKYDMVFVQGDTTTVFVGALSAFYQKIPVAHIEAGLRTSDRYSPFPEEINRRLAGNLATLHFAPTQRARDNLLRENIPEASIYVSGNTVIDALEWSLKQPHQLPDDLESFLSSGKKTILVTTHRRENFGKPHREVFGAILDLVMEFRDIQILLPIHPNPNVREEAHRLLNNHERVKLISPVSYPDFIQLMKRSYLIMTDSGGIQEEAPSLNIPLLILRESTERPEGVESGCLKLVGTDRNKIFSTAKNLLEDKNEYENMARAVNPFGDGKAAERIIEHVLNFLQK
ncbi:MAG: UDP-N-acetylglucosamine 2-epimerase (non-hydrolyzing) [Candidatus Rifleibacteriota bacterium]